MAFFLYFFSWKDYFSGQEISLSIKNQNFEQRQTSITGNCYILNCFFEVKNQLQNSNGGAIDGSKADILMVESSTFLNCQTTKNGGAIYYENRANGECVISKACSYGCIITTSKNCQGSFCYSIVGFGNKNNLEGSSVVKTEVDLITFVSKTVSLEYGLIKLSNNNISNNMLRLRSAFCCINRESCQVSFSSFRNNTSDQECIDFEGGLESVMNTCNIIENKANDYSIFYTNGKVCISDSCFLFNTNKLFHITNDGTSYIKLSKCTVDGLVNTQVGLTIESNASSSFINEIIYNRCQFTKYSTTKLITCNSRHFHSRIRIFNYI